MLILIQTIVFASLNSFDYRLSRPITIQIIMICLVRIGLSPDLMKVAEIVPEHQSHAITMYEISGGGASDALAI